MNMENWIGDFVFVAVVVVFDFLDWEHLFWVNLVQKFKTVS